MKKIIQFFKNKPVKEAINLACGFTTVYPDKPLNRMSDKEFNEFFIELSIKVEKI